MISEISQEKSEYRHFVSKEELNASKKRMVGIYEGAVPHRFSHPTQRDERSLQSGVAGYTMGTLQFINDIGTVHCNWDDERTLGLIYGEDSFSVIPQTEQNQEEEHTTDIKQKTWCNVLIINL